MNDDDRDGDPLEEIRRRLEQPLSEDEIDDIEVLMAFESLIDPGHWCAACGEEQPAGPPGGPACAECYDTDSYLADRAELRERAATVALMTPSDLRDLSWLWRS